MSKTSKILIVGINSFLGKYLAKMLIDDHYIIGVYHVNLDNNVIADEFLDMEELSRMAFQNIQTVYIISAYIPYVKTINDTKLLIETNVLLVERLCSQFQDANIVYCSSVSVYDSLHANEAISEKTRPNTETPYGLSKLWAEQVIKRCRFYSIVRFSSIYGVGMTNHTFLPKIIDSAIRNKMILLYGDGSRLQNYIHVEDAAKILKKMVVHRNNDLYLGVGGRAYSNLEIALIVQRLTACEVKFVGEDSSISFVYDQTKVSKLFQGNTDFKDMHEGLTEIIKWKIKQY